MTLYTTSTVFLKTLRQYGITHAFVNWGSDHPALLEELERQRVSNGTTDIEIVTCPNEMVALSCAQGYAQVTGRPAAVLVHVDVGTQALAGAVHNVDRCRTPVLIYAGASAFTLEGELKGSRNEFIMWLQDVPDQPAIVRQYMRYTGQIHSGKNVQQAVLRGLQIATSDPKGPVYLWARREAMEEDVEEAIVNKTFEKQHWGSIEPAGLSPTVAKKIALALATAQSPLIITSYLGRNVNAVDKLVGLSEKLAIPVYLSCPSAVNFPHNHPNLVDLSYGFGKNEWLRLADVILIVDSDIPFIPLHNKPQPDATIFHIDVDVLKDNMGIFHVDATSRCKADAEVALTQILESLNASVEINTATIQARATQIAEKHNARVKSLQSAELSFPEDGSFVVPNVLGLLRKRLPSRTLILNEGISNYPLAWDHLRPDAPGSFHTSGASSLGWGLGASIGASLGAKASGKEYDLTVLVVGDGSFLFGVPGSAYWIARKYKTPFLTVILNNSGWKSPKLSMLGVYPEGLGSKVPGAQLTVGFGPDVPDYSQIAVAAGGAWGKRVTLASELEGAISEGIKVVTEERRCAVIDFVIESI